MLVREEGSWPLKASLSHRKGNGVRKGTNPCHALPGCGHSNCWVPFSWLQKATCWNEQSCLPAPPSSVYDWVKQLDFLSLLMNWLLLLSHHWINAWQTDWFLTGFSNTPNVPFLQRTLSSLLTTILMSNNLFPSMSSNWLTQTKMRLNLWNSPMNSNEIHWHSPLPAPLLADK